MKWSFAIIVMAAVCAAGAFEKVPQAAMVALKGARGKNVSTGFVFVDGRYVKPPYKVARYGTAIFVNDIQITDQIVAWKNFLATSDSTDDFVPNERSEKLLKRIDESRLEVRRKLRSGNVCFFGSRYARVLVEPRLARQLMDVLPEALRDASEAEDLESLLRANGISYLPRALCEDLLNNRADYLPLIDRRRKLREEEDLQKMIDGTRDKNW